MPVIRAFITTEVAINAFIGPPADGNISSGSIKRLVQKIPIGGIQHDFKMAVVLMTPSHTYCTQPVHKILNRVLKKGRIIHPSPAKDHPESDGNHTISPKVIRVKITACTSPNVKRIA